MVAEVIGGLLKIMGRLLVDVVFEIAIRWTGTQLCYPLNRHINPDGGLVVCVGLVFWAGLAAIIYMVYRQVL